MRLRLTLATLFFMSASHVQGATLKGVVLANELGGPPVPNVQVTAVAGTNPTASLSDGTFTLQFPKKHAGEIVQLIVRKQGYVVVNDVQLRLPLPKDTEAEPLILLLCRESDREEMARRFYRLKSLQAIEQTFQKRLQELEAKNQATAATLAELRNDRDQAKAAAERAAEELARLKPEPTSEVYQQALSLFLTGKVEEALALLDEEKLRRTVQAARQRKAEAEREITDVCSSCLLKSQLLTTLFRFDEAEKMYQAAIDAAPGSFRAHFAFGCFSQGLNRFQNALTAYARALDLARQNEAPAVVAMTLNSLGTVHLAQNRREEARKEFEEALKIRRDLAQKNPDAHLLGVAETLNNLGILHSEQNRMDEASKQYEEALRISRELVKRNPEIYLPGLAKTLGNLGPLYYNQNRMDEASEHYEEALRAFRELAQRNPDVYLPDLAKTLGSLGNLHSYLNRMDEAGKHYEEALEIFLGLSKRTPEAYLPDMAKTLNNLANLHSAQNRIDEARMDHEEALKIRRELAQKNPDAYLPDVAVTLNNLGIVYSDQNRMDEASGIFEEALKIRRELAQRDPNAYLPHLATSLHNLGNLLRLQHRTDEAKRYYEDALSIRRELAQKNPDIYLPYMAMTLNDLGVLYSDQNRIDEARQAYQEALTIYEQFAKRNPRRFERKFEEVKELLNKLP